MESGYFIGTLLTLSVYVGVLFLNKRMKLPMFNSVLYSTIIIVIVLLLFGIDYDDYSHSAKPISSTLGPMVTLLAIPLYKYQDILKQHYKSVFLGIFISGLTSILSVVILSNLFGLSNELMVTLLPKSITTPMALSMTDMLGGISGITVIAVIITGITGATVASSLISIFKITSPVAIGVALGSSAHGIGTSKGIELGSDIGAISGLSMALTGIIFILSTSIIMIF